MRRGLGGGGGNLDGGGGNVSVVASLSAWPVAGEVFRPAGEFVRLVSEERETVVHTRDSLLAKHAVYSSHREQNHSKLQRRSH